MPETEWNSTTPPEEGAIVYVLAAETIGGNTRFHSRSSFETIAGGTLAQEKSLTLLSWGGAQPAMSNDDAQCIWKICFSGPSRPEW